MTNPVPLAQVRARTLDVYAAALRGDLVQVRHADGRTKPLNSRRWLGPARGGDLSLLHRVEGATLDAGCGPGRLVAGVAGRSLPTLGIDVHEAAVQMTRETGSLALLRSVFDPIPGERRWDTVLLVDGNIGIGGDPSRLLRRVRELLAPGGRLLLELDSPGTGLVTEALRLEHADGSSPWFRWSSVGVDALAALAVLTSMTVEQCWSSMDVESGRRWFAVLTKS